MWADAVGEQRRRTVSGGLVATLGLLLSAFPVWHWATRDEPFLADVLGAVVPLILGLALAAIGVSIARGDLDLEPAYALRPLYGAALGVGVMLVVVTVLVLHVAVQEDAFPHPLGILPLLVITGALFGTLAGLADARERQQTDLAARKERRLNDIVSSIDEVVWMVSGDLTELRYVSPNVEQVWGPGFDVTTLQDIAAFESVHPDDRADLESFVTGLGTDVERGTVEVEYDVEYRIERTDGEVRWLHADVRPVVVDDDVDYFVGVTRDVTDRHEYERRLERKTEQLALLNRIVRHDVRNDMSVVVGWLDLLEEKVPPDAREELRTIMEATDNVIELTTSLRDLVEVVESDGDLPLEPIAIDAILANELEHFENTHDHATLTAALAPLDGVAVAGNPMLTSVFRNLLNNAVQHSDRESPTVAVEAEHGEGTVRIRVVDDGPGVPDDRKQAVFGRGERGLESAGSGVGLYLVDTVVSACDGTVWVEDADPRGAAFVVELPVSSDDPRTPADSRAPTK